MIRPLRRAHLRIAIGLALVLPLSFASILLLRPDVMRLPVVTQSAMPDAIGGLGLRARLERRPDGGPAVTLAMAGAAPDSLVYWSMARQALPAADAVLLGPLLPHTQSYVLPEAAGYLLIYSVAYGETQLIVPVASLERAR